VSRMCILLCYHLVIQYNRLNVDADVSDHRGFLWSSQPLAVSSAYPGSTSCIVNNGGRDNRI